MEPRCALYTSSDKDPGFCHLVFPQATLNISASESTYQKCIELLLNCNGVVPTFWLLQISGMTIMPVIPSGPYCGSIIMDTQSRNAAISTWYDTYIGLVFMSSLIYFQQTPDNALHEIAEVLHQGLNIHLSLGLTFQVRVQLDPEGGVVVQYRPVHAQKRQCRILL